MRFRQEVQWSSKKKKKCFNYLLFMSLATLIFPQITAMTSSQKRKVFISVEFQSPNLFETKIFFRFGIKMNSMLFALYTARFSF